MYIFVEITTIRLNTYRIDELMIHKKFLDSHFVECQTVCVLDYYALQLKTV